MQVLIRLTVPREILRGKEGPRPAVTVQLDLQEVASPRHFQNKGDDSFDVFHALGKPIADTTDDPAHNHRVDSDYLCSAHHPVNHDSGISERTIAEF